VPESYYARKAALKRFPAASLGASLERLKLVRVRAAAAA
jgi:hypothetical protein